LSLGASLTNLIFVPACILAVLGCVRTAGATESIEVPSVSMNSTLLIKKLQADSFLPPRNSSREPLIVQVQLVMLNILEVSTELQTLELQVSVSVLNVLSLRDPSHAATGC
jgi:hypothetical protein